MPLFVIHCIDKPGLANVRARWRDEHIAHVRGAGVTRIAGPILGEGERIEGSLMIVEFPDLAAARDFADADPYVRAGLFAGADVRPFRLTVLDVKDQAP